MDEMRAEAKPGAALARLSPSARWSDGWRSRCPRDWLREPDDRWVRPLCATDSVDRSALVIGDSVSADCDSSLPASRAQQFEFCLVKSRGQIVDFNEQNLGL